MYTNNKFKKTPQYLNFEKLSSKFLVNTLFHDYNIERSVLSVMISIEDKQSLGIEYLNADAFFYEENRQVFNFIRHKRDQNTKSIVSYSFTDLSNFLATDEQIQKMFPLVNQGLLNDLSTLMVNENNFLNYVQKLIELSKLRLLEVFYNDTANSMKHKSEIKFQNCLTDFETFVINNKIDTIDNSSFISLSEATNNFREVFEKIREKGDSYNDDSIFTGFHAIDKFTNGFKQGQLIILAARPGVGKTALALNIVSNVLKNKKRNCAFISLEMPVNELVVRYYSANSRTPMSKIIDPRTLTAEEHSVLNDSFHNDTALERLYFDDSPSSKITDIVWKIKHLSKELLGKLDFVVVDYLQLLSGGSLATGNRQNEVSLISRALKTLALDLKIPIMALSQLSRTVEQREDKRPQLHDLRESGSIEQDADIVIFLNRSNKFLQEKTNNEDKNSPIKTDVTIAKNRNGQPGISNIYFEGKIVLFQEIQEDNY
ncbi:DnaB-like helicase C-terminal domain-containing protein [Mycoplasma sp. OR1901]|uniref:DnaB-like helicase C-terminal domain-containing protein n=1 Tax=Mycoplasma sp. OR1901 TaxID=2742195 RepID=UPI001583B093|nr:DnaB-like helicase C-terminal domain-containing protein [Mycoplasma sp. OR1901]QKT05284.1 AAA family ATPase [Mycoplasma sp. OR1901]